MKDLHLIDIYQVNNILFLDKNTGRTSRAIDHLDITLNHCFMKYCVHQFKTKINHNNLQAIIQYRVVTCIHRIWGSTLLSISFHLNFFLVCQTRH